MLLLLDLDNTLVDRAAAFARWAGGWASAHGAGAGDVAWLIATDNDGYEPRERFAGKIAERFGGAAEEVLAELRAGMVDQLTEDPQVTGALHEAVGAGWVPVVVTNGSVAQQEAKLHRTGLAGLVSGWVVSEGAGVSKPDPRIFELAAEQAGAPLAGGWMVGDHAEYDIGGAVPLGLNTAWLARGREWPEELPYRPTLIANDCATAIRSALAGGRCG